MQQVTVVGHLLLQGKWQLSVTRLPVQGGLSLTGDTTRPFEQRSRDLRGCAILPCRFPRISWTKPQAVLSDLQLALLRAGRWTIDLMRSLPIWIMLRFHQSTRTYCSNYYQTVRLHLPSAGMALDHVQKNGVNLCQPSRATSWQKKFIHKREVWNTSS